MDQRYEHVIIETERHRISGTVTLPRYRSRVSDLLNAPERDFVALTNVTIEPLEGGRPGTEHPFMAISRRHIVFAIPVGEAGDAAQADDGDAAAAA